MARARRVKIKKPYDPRRDGVTQGLLARWLRCRVDAKFYLEGWRPVGRKRSLRFGSFVHEALQKLYTAIKAGKVKTPPGAFSLIRATCRKTLPVAAIMDGEPAQDVELDAGLTEILMTAYVNHYVRDFKKVWVNVEKTFDVEAVVGGRSLRLRGRRDGMPRLGKALLLWLLETKTKSRISEDTLEHMLSFDFQNLFYLFSAKLEFGEEVKGVVYNIIRTPGQRRGKDENLKGYLRRVSADVHKRPEHYFKRYEVTYSKRVRRRFELELGMKLDEFFEWCSGDRPTYRNESACQGRWNCSYIPACASGRMVGFTQTGKLFEELD